MVFMQRFLACLRFVVCCAVLAGLGACGAITAQNPDAGYSPVNATAQDGSDRLLLGGADVVAYFTQGRHVQGVREHRVRFGDIDLYFSSPLTQALFLSEPRKYLPQYGGYCANGIVFGIPWGGNAQDWLIHEGRLYIFGGAESKAVFALDLKRNVGLADSYWSSEIEGNNSFVQRAKRLVFRVPHYQTTEDQRKLLKAAQPG